MIWNNPKLRNRLFSWFLTATVLIRLSMAIFAIERPLSLVMGVMAIIGMVVLSLDYPSTNKKWHEGVREGILDMSSINLYTFVNILLVLFCINSILSAQTRWSSLHESGQMAVWVDGVTAVLLTGSLVYAHIVRPLLRRRTR